MKKYLTFIVAFLILVTNVVSAAELNKTVAYLEKKELDQWGILSLYAHGEDVSPYTLKKPNSDVLTDYERYIMGAVPLGHNIYDIVKKIAACQKDNGKFSDYIDGTGDDFVNAHIWGIISLYSSKYEKYDKAKALEWLKSNQNDDGGFPIQSGDTHSDLDMTAMAMIAYSILGLDKDASEIQNAIVFLEKNISKRESCEAYAWYILARIKLGLEVDADLFNNLGKYKMPDGSFMHFVSSKRSNYMASWHGLLALADYHNKESIFTKLHNTLKFLDLGKEDIGYEEIMLLVKKEVVSGYPDNTFKPSALVKRSEFCKFLIYGLGLQNQISNETDRFHDLKGHWSNKIVNVAVNKGFIKGVTNNQFAPEAKIKGAEVAALLVRANGLESKALEIEGTNWYDGYVAIANKSDLLYRNFKAESYVSREQCAEAIYKLMN